MNEFPTDCAPSLTSLSVPNPLPSFVRVHRLALVGRVWEGPGAANGKAELGSGPQVPNTYKGSAQISYTAHVTPPQDIFGFLR